MSDYTIHKFPLLIVDEQRVFMPRGARILHLDMQGTTLCMWAEVDPDVPKVSRTFLIRGTGHPFSGQEGRYVGSVQERTFVWHVYEMARFATA